MLFCSIIPVGSACFLLFFIQFGFDFNCRDEYWYIKHIIIVMFFSIFFSCIMSKSILGFIGWFLLHALNKTCSIIFVSLIGFLGIHFLFNKFRKTN